RHRPHRWPRVQTGRGAARTALKGDAGGRAQDNHRGVARVVGGGLRQEPHELWRYGAEERGGAGESLAEALGKRAKIGLSGKISLQFLGLFLGFRAASALARRSQSC